MKIVWLSETTQTTTEKTKMKVSNKTKKICQYMSYEECIECPLSWWMTDFLEEPDYIFCSKYDNIQIKKERWNKETLVKMRHMLNNVK